MDVSKLYEKAEEAIKRKNYDYAIDILAKQILPIYPNDVKARKLLRGTVIKKYEEAGYPGKLAKMKIAKNLTVAKTLTMRKQWDKAMEEIEGGLLVDPKDVNLLYELASCAKEGGHTATAISTLENAVQIKPEHTKSLKLLGYLFWETNELEKAQNYFQQVAKIDPTDNAAKKAVKDISAQKTSADYGKAKSSKDLVKDKGAAEKAEKDGHILRTSDDIKDAIGRAEMEYEEDPSNKKTMRRLGELYAKMEETEKAVEWFQKYLAVDPTSFDVKCLLGDAQIAMHEREQKAARDAAKADPENAELKKKYGAAKKKAQVFAIEELRKRVAEHPTDLALRFQLGERLYANGDLEEAIGEFQKSCKDPKYKMDSFSRMGEGFLKQGDADSAIRQFQKALEGMSGMGDKMKAINYHLGCAYADSGDVDKSLEVFQQILEADIAYKDVRQKVKDLKAGKTSQKQP